MPLKAFMKAHPTPIRFHFLAPDVNGFSSATLSYHAKHQLTAGPKKTGQLLLDCNLHKHGPKIRLFLLQVITMNNLRA